MPFFLQPEYPLGTIRNACFTCNTDRRPTDRLVDLGVNIDFEGFAVMCETCAAEIARLLGYETVDMRAQRTAEAREMDDLREENARLRAVVELGVEALSG